MTKVRTRSQVVGPAFDPYGRDTLTVSTKGHEYEFVSCGLAGCTYIRDGEKVVENDFDGNVAADAMKRDTGYAPWDWERFLAEYEARNYDPMDDYYRGYV